MQEIQIVINLIILLFPFNYSTENVIQEPFYFYLLIFLFMHACLSFYLKQKIYY